MAVNNDLINTNEELTMTIAKKTTTQAVARNRAHNRNALLLSLPLEIKHHVYSHLLPRDLSRLRTICTGLRDLIDNDKTTLEAILLENLAYLLSIKKEIYEANIHGLFSNINKLLASSNLLTAPFFDKTAIMLYQKIIEKNKQQEASLRTLFRYFCNKKNYAFKFIQENDLNTELLSAQTRNHDANNHQPSEKISYVLCFYAESTHEWIANHVLANGVIQETDKQLIEKLNELNPLQIEDHNNNEALLTTLCYLLQERDFQKKASIFFREEIVMLRQEIFDDSVIDSNTRYLIYDFLRLTAVSRSLLAGTIEEINLQIDSNNFPAPLANDPRQLKVENFARLFGEDLFVMQSDSIGEKAISVIADKELRRFYSNCQPSRWETWGMGLGGLSGLGSTLYGLIDLLSKPDTRPNESSEFTPVELVATLSLLLTLFSAGSRAYKNSIGGEQIMARVEEIEKYQTRYYSNCNILFSHKPPLPIIEIIEPNTFDPNIPVATELTPLLRGRLGTA